MAARTLAAASRRALLRDARVRVVASHAWQAPGATRASSTRATVGGSVRAHGAYGGIGSAPLGQSRPSYGTSMTTSRGVRGKATAATEFFVAEERHEAAAALRIAELDLVDEFVQVHNGGTQPVALADWRIISDTGSQVGEAVISVSTAPGQLCHPRAGCAQRAGSGLRPCRL